MLIDKKSIEQYPSFTLETNRPIEFKLLGVFSHISILRMEFLYLRDNRSWFEKLDEHELTLKVELAANSGANGSMDYTLSNYLLNVYQRQPIIDLHGFELPNQEMRTPIGNGGTHFDRMKLTLTGNTTELVKVKFSYKNNIDYSTLVLRCFNCNTRCLFSDAYVDWEMVESQERAMGVEIMYSGDFSGYCPKCSEHLGVQFLYWTYPEGVLNYHESKGENCLVVQNPDFMRRHHEKP